MQAEVVCHAHRPYRVACAVRHDGLDRVSDVDEKLDVVDRLRFNPTFEVAIRGDSNAFVDDLDGEFLWRWPQLRDVVSDFGERGLGSMHII
jgi:hypothetical protein